MSRYTSDEGQWCRLEIVGHLEHVGRAKEVDLLTGKALRICDETEEYPIEYGMCAIFSIVWLPEAAGQEESARRLADYDERKKRGEFGANIGEIQRLIYLTLGSEKLSYEAIESRVSMAAPRTLAGDFKEAIENLGLDRWPIADGDSLYWRDPDCPF